MKNLFILIGKSGVFLREQKGSKTIDCKRSILRQRAEVRC
jgi:hypothetical protein